MVQTGRPSVPKDVRELIRLMRRANPTWGAPRIHGELLKLGMNIGETSVSKYMVRHRKPPSQTWRTFLENHVKNLVSVDFFTVPTLRGQVYGTGTYSGSASSHHAAHYGFDDTYVIDSEKYVYVVMRMRKNRHSRVAHLIVNAPLRFAAEKGS